MSRRVASRASPAPSSRRSSVASSRLVDAPGVDHASHRDRRRVAAESKRSGAEASLALDRQRTLEDAFSLNSVASNAPSPGATPRVSSRLPPGAWDERQLAADASRRIIRTTLCDR